MFIFVHFVSGKNFKLLSSILDLKQKFIFSNKIKYKLKILLDEVITS